MAEILAGVARAVITPPVGIPMVGFAGRGPAEAVHDELLVTALALESGECRAVILALDVIGVGDRLLREVRGEIETRTGFAGCHVLLCASHTHYGPATGAYERDDQPPDVAAYVSNLKFLLVGAAQAAFSRLQSVHLGFGEGESRIGINRRERRPDGEIVLGQNPAGPCDRSVRVVRLDTAEGRPLAALVNFACHPVSAAHAMREISADYVGVMRNLVEGATGATCLFLQGAAGNINPVEMRHSLEPARRLGTMLGGEAAKVFESIPMAQAPEIPGLAAASRAIDLPGMTFLSMEEGEEAIRTLEANLERLRASQASEGSLWWATSRLESARKRLESLKTGVPLPTIPAEVTALRFGDICLATAPGEIFTETGMAIKRRSPLPFTLFAAYTNGTIGYVPVPGAYPEGGYEVTQACRVAPEAAGMIENTAVELLEQVSPGAS